MRYERNAVLPVVRVNHCGELLGAELASKRLEANKPLITAVEPLHRFMSLGRKCILGLNE